MSFADNYLSKQKRYKSVFDNSLHDERFVIIIPCYNEPFILTTLNSISSCIKTLSGFHVIIVINSSENDKKEIKEQNALTLNDIIKWNRNTKPFFTISIIYEPELPAKHAGAGFARKIGMDEAIFRLNEKNIPNGVLISLDADTTVEKNYLKEIENLYLNNSKINGSIFYFEHPINGHEYSDNIYQSIILYELHLRYFVEALKFCKFPYAYHTIGACFSVSANIYLKVGGMGRNQAGEDFYFLHKAFSHGNFYNLNTTCVYPSPRISNRVPFGTGPAIKKIIDNNLKYKTYHPTVFDEIKKIIEIFPQLFNVQEKKIKQVINELPGNLNTFLKKNDFINEIIRINNNCKQLSTFSKHFFNWFNAFRIIKFINIAHEKYYNKIDAEEAANELLVKTGKTEKYLNNPAEILLKYRKLQK